MDTRLGITLKWGSINTHVSFQSLQWSFKSRLLLFGYLSSIQSLNPH